MANTRKCLKEIKLGILDLAKFNAIPYKFIAYDVKHTNKYVVETNNPVRKALRMTGVVLTTPLHVPVHLVNCAVYIAISSAMTAVVTPFATVWLLGSVVYDSAKWTFKKGDNFVARWDDVPAVANLEQPNMLQSELQRNNAENSSVIILKQLKNADESDDSLEFTPYVNAYIESFSQKPSYAEQVKNLHLTDAEKVQFDKFIDPITHEIINIPVKLNDRLYDLQSLLQCFAATGNDPFNNIPFKLSNISTERKTSEKMQALIDQIKVEKAASVQVKESELLPQLEPIASKMVPS